MAASILNFPGRFFVVNLNIPEIWMISILLQISVAQSAGAVEYTNYISAEW